MRLSWTTATETNNRGFEIERQINNKPSGGKWEKIGFVGGFGTTSETKTYTFVDNKVNKGKYDYRLKQIDFDGTYKYLNEIEVIVNSPAEFALAQNYPNPFNPTTTINYSIQENGFVRLSIYNSLGEKVEELVNGNQDAGNHSVTFNAKNLSSGIYYYRLEANDKAQVNKMMILK